MAQISCIIAAYNEAPRIGAVLSPLQGHPLIDEVIVVDDGSTDKTRNIVKKFPNVRLLINETNSGKSFSVSKGITAAKNEYLMMLDADLEGITPQNITDLATPIISNRADVTLSLRGNSLGIYKMLGMDFYSGERVFSKKLLKNKMRTIAKLPGFALETVLNRIIISKKLRVQVAMIRSILRVISIPEIIRQNYRLRSLTTSEEERPVSNLK
jgi:glycosyltransferase involved in cell wall biosynthesis